MKVCSIIIPVYNGEKFLKKTIDSCLAQETGFDVEIIVVDDGSTDSSVKIIDSYGEKVVFIQNQENLGINKSLNKAAKTSRGEFILFMGHDDLLKPNHVEIMLNEFDEHTAFVHCNADLIDANDTVFGTSVSDNQQMLTTKFIKYYLTIGNLVHSTGTVIQKKFLDDVGGWDEQFRNYGEWPLWIKLASIGRVRYSIKTRALYRRHQTNITNSFNDTSVKKDLSEYFLFCRTIALSKIDSIFIRFLLTSCIHLAIKLKKL